VQSKVLFIAGVALVVSVFVPFDLKPLVFAWTNIGPEGGPSLHLPLFEYIIWPMLAGVAYLLLTVAPPNIRQQIPPIVLHWLPFAVSYAGIFISHMGYGFYVMLSGMGAQDVTFAPNALYILGYSTLVFGLLARIAQPQDQIARIVIAIGAAMLVIPFFQSFDIFKAFGHMPIMGVITSLLTFIITLLGVLCIVFVVPPQKLPPALQAVDALGPLVAAILLAWLPVQQLFVLFASLSHEVVGPVLWFVHGILVLVAFFGVLMMAAPAAYEEAKSLFTKGPGGSAGGGYPPQGGGYPPQSGGYPPQGGGYPPQGGGYPPQQGGWQ
jgi:hypothetical protein